MQMKEKYTQIKDCRIVFIFMLVNADSKQSSFWRLVKAGRNLYLDVSKCRQMTLPGTGYL